MATMYYLFFGLFSLAVCGTVDAGHPVLARRYPADAQTSVDLAPTDNLRERIIAIAAAEIGVKEATGHNDGSRVEEYLAYTGLGKGHAWCAAFVSWCYGKAGLALPHNAWSPALFPASRRYSRREVAQGAVRPADLFACYNLRLARIDHAGLVKKVDRGFILTIEGNVDNRVLSRRRALITVYAFANWLGRKEGK